MIGAAIGDFRDRKLRVAYTVEPRAGKRELLCLMAPEVTHFGGTSNEEWAQWRGRDIMVAITLCFYRI